MAKPKSNTPTAKIAPKVGDVVQRLEDLQLGDVLAVDDLHITVQWRSKGGRRVQLARSAQGSRWRIEPTGHVVQDVAACSQEQLAALADGRAVGEAYFVVTSLEVFERDFGRLPDPLRAAWAKLQAASDALASLLDEQAVRAAEDAAAENDGE